jgi:hypothetical protein
LFFHVKKIKKIKKNTINGTIYRKSWWNFIQLTMLHTKDDEDLSLCNEYNEEFANLFVQKYQGKRLIKIYKTQFNSVLDLHNLSNKTK